MIIQIRIVIDVPLEDETRFPEAIEKIVDEVARQFPGLQIARPNSPVIVTITRQPEKK